MTSTGKILLLALLLLFTFVTTYKEKKQITEFRVLDKILYIPSNYDIVKFIPEDQVIEFSIDTNTFQPPLSSNESRKNKQLLSVEIRGLHSETGEKNYWTKNDPILKSVPKKCETIIYKDKSYDLCQYDKNPSLVSGMNEFFAIKTKNSDNYLAIYGCHSTVCTGRSRLQDNLQIEFVLYRAELHRIVEIMQEMHNLSLNLLNKPKLS